MIGTIPSVPSSLVKVSPSLARIESGDKDDRLSRLRQLSQEAYSLNEGIDVEVSRVERLQRRVEDGHRALGTLVKESMAIQRAMAVRRQQNERDDQDLVQARTSIATRREQLQRVLEEMRDVSK